VNKHLFYKVVHIKLEENDTSPNSTWRGPNKELLRATGKAHCSKPHSVFVSDMK
jgi:hypothetical protein